MRFAIKMPRGFGEEHRADCRAHRARQRQIDEQPPELQTVTDCGKIRPGGESIIFDGCATKHLELDDPNAPVPLPATKLVRNTCWLAVPTCVASKSPT